MVFWLHRVTGLWSGLSGNRMVRSCSSLHELRDGERLPGEQRLVVGGHVLARAVEAVRPLATVSSACRWCASAFIIATPLLTDPVAWATDMAASFAEIISMALNRSDIR